MSTMTVYLPVTVLLFLAAFITPVSGDCSCRSPSG